MPADWCETQLMSNAFRMIRFFTVGFLLFRGGVLVPARGTVQKVAMREAAVDPSHGMARKVGGHGENFAHERLVRAEQQQGLDQAEAAAAR